MAGESTARVIEEKPAPLSVIQGYGGGAAEGVATVRQQCPFGNGSAARGDANIVRQERADARRLMFASLVYLPTILTVMAVDKVGL